MKERLGFSFLLTAIWNVWVVVVYVFFGQPWVHVYIYLCIPLHPVQICASHTSSVKACMCAHICLYEYVYVCTYVHGTDGEPLSPDFGESSQSFISSWYSSPNPSHFAPEPCIALLAPGETPKSGQLGQGKASSQHCPLLFSSEWWWQFRPRLYRRKTNVPKVLASPWLPLFESLLFNTAKKFLWTEKSFLSQTGVLSYRVSPFSLTVTKHWR